MPASRNYSSTAGLMHLVGGITGAAASLIVDATTGLPATPFTLLLDPGLAAEEIVEVTAVGGTTLTVTRGVDGTSARAHLNGAEVRHAYSARDFQDSRNHEAATAAHGVTGAVVGTTNTQTLTNKSIDGTTNTFTNVPKVALPADVTYNATAQTLTNKTIDGASNTLTNVPLTALPRLPVPVNNAADRDAQFPVPYDGLQVYRLDLHVAERYDGTTWRPIAPYATYTTQVTTAADGTFAVTFPAGRFSVTPYVFATINGITICTAIVSSPTTSGCTGKTLYWAGGTTWAVTSGFLVQIFAVQGTATTSAG